MVQYRKPVKLSENIVDLRVGQSPRGSLPAAVAAMLLRKQQDLQKQLQREFLAQQEKLAKAAALARLRSRRG